ncbi:serine/threonine-protein kinase [Streptomyces bicolor]|uniref:serine/threonine-protein kinase n=1 Tax=Streptomyces bicolor TaxID=66874 RepID=UPI00068DBC01|nr:serine/threonine-protein kinase [Streptomyces bicolor]
MQPLKPDDPGRVGDYRLLGRLGSGGMGTVYLGRSRGGREVAVKVVRERAGRDAHYRARFRREVAAARTVTGAFTAALLDADPEAEAPWLVMEYLPGLSLREAVETYGGLPTDALRLLAAALAEALADIHRAGLAHRDLKPGNIMLTARGPRVIDFGISRPADALALTVPGTLLGTPGFMSPEQASGGVAGPAGDIFGLGAVLAFSATGQEPFSGPDRAAVLERVRQARTDLRGITDRRLRSLIAACLHPEPHRRPAATALLDRLGEPTASVQGTGWLPAPLAEAIDRTVARAELPAGTAPPPAAAHGIEGLLRGEATADPTAATDDSSPASAAATLGGWSRRRALLLAAGVLPVAAVPATIAVLRTEDERSAPPRSSPSSPRPTTARPGAAQPSVAARVWTTKVVDRGIRAPDLYRAGTTVLATNSEESHVRALDPRTGKILWSRTADTSGATYVTAGSDAAYLFDARDGNGTADYTLRAVAASSGTTRWTARVPFFPWGTAATGPVVCFAYHNEMKALDAEDGRPRWTAAMPSASSTFMAAAGLVVMSGDGVLFALDADSGRIRWRRELPRSAVKTFIGDGIVFGCDNAGTVYAVHADDGTIAWKKAFDPRSSVRHAGAGLLYVAETDGLVRAFRADTGKPVWSRRPAEEGDSYIGTATLGLSGGTLWVQGSDLTVYALATTDGRVLWTYAAQAATDSTSLSGLGGLSVGGLVLLGTVEGHVEAVRPPGTVNGETSGAA